MEAEKQQADRARAVSEDNVRQLIGEVKKLNEDKQSLQQQVSRLNEETTIKETQLNYKQRAIDSLHRESDEQQRAMERTRAEKGELQQRIDEVEQLLTNAEAASEAAERRLSDSKQVLNIPARDVQLSDKELGSGSFGGALCVLSSSIVHLPMPQLICLPILLVCRSISCHLLFLSASVLLLLYQTSGVCTVCELVLSTRLLTVLAALLVPVGAHERPYSKVNMKYKRAEIPSMEFSKSSI